MLFSCLPLDLRFCLLLALLFCLLLALLFCLLLFIIAPVLRVLLAVLVHRVALLRSCRHKLVGCGCVSDDSVARFWLPSNITTQHCALRD